MSLSREHVILEEYKAFRAEVIFCLERRVTILSYGLAAIGVLTGAAVTAVNANKWYVAAVVF